MSKVGIVAYGITPFTKEDQKIETVLHSWANKLFQKNPSIEKKDMCEVWGVEVSKKLMKFIPEKGSVALNGTSLTVNNVVENIFYINLIPHTLLSTNLSSLKIGGMVNIEIDMIARYLQNIYTK